MTAIAGVEYDGGVVIGGDNAATWDSTYSQLGLTADKVWERGDWVFGACGSVRADQLVRYSFDPPLIPDDQGDDLEEYLSTRFMDQLRAVLVDSGVVHSKNAVEELVYSSSYLIGIRGQLWVLDEDFGVVRSSAGYWAVGCGKDLALGALHATVGEDPEERVFQALEAASAHNAGVAPPYSIINKPYESV